MKKLAQYIYKLQLFMGFLSISIFFVAIIIQIFARYTQFTVLWTGELAEYSFIWSVMMGAGAMAYENKHFAFTTFLDKLHGVNKEILKIIIALTVGTFGAAILFYGVQITQKFWNYRWTTLPAIQMGYMWICLPILGFSVVVYSFVHITEYLYEIKLQKEGGK